MTRHSPADYHFVVRPFTSSRDFKSSVGYQTFFFFFSLQPIEMLVTAYVVKMGGI